MDDALQVGNVNWGATDSAINQAATSLEQAPGLILEDMKCSEAFCRATLASETGERPTLQDLYGRPPFVNEGFTIDEPDGRVTVYFTPPEVSLEDLRAEARQVAEFDLSQ